MSQNSNTMQSGTKINFEITKLHDMDRHELYWPCPLHCISISNIVLSKCLYMFLMFFSNEERVAKVYGTMLNLAGTVYSSLI